MKKIYNLVLAFCVLVGCFYALLPSKAFAQLKSASPNTDVTPGSTVDVRILIKGGTTQARSSADIILTMDVTGSMGEMFGSEQKIDAAKKALKAFVNESTVNVDHIGLVTYAAPGAFVGTSCAGPVYSTCSTLVFPLSNMTNTNKAALNNAIDAISANGGTSIGAGVDTSYRELTDQIESLSKVRPGVPKYMVLATDGRQNVFPNPYQNGILNSIKALGIQIFTVGIGYDVNIEGPLGECGIDCPYLQDQDLWTSNPVTGARIWTTDPVTGANFSNPDGVNDKYNTGEIIMKDLACQTDSDCNASESTRGDNNTSTNDLGTPFHYFYADKPDELVNFYKEIFKLIDRQNAYQVLDSINSEIFESIIPGTIQVTNCTGSLWPNDDVVANVDNGTSMYIVVKNVDVDQNACIDFKAQVHNLLDTVNCNGVSMMFNQCIKTKTDFDIDGSPRIMGSFDPDLDVPTCIDNDSFLTSVELDQCLDEMPFDKKIIDPGSIKMKSGLPIGIGKVDVFVKQLDSSGNCSETNPVGVDGAKVFLTNGTDSVSRDTLSDGSISPPFGGLANGNYTLTASNFGGLGVVKQVISGGPAISHPPSFDFNLNIANPSRTAVFCVGSSSPWYQTDLGDVGFYKINNPIPFDQFGSTKLGVYHSLVDGSYGAGEISPKKWRVDNEYSYNFKTSSKNGTFSISFFKAKAKQDGVNITEITSTNNLNNGVLSASYTAGKSGEIFEYPGSVVLNNSINIPSSKRVVILINGDLNIKDRIDVALGGLLVLAVRGNIIIDKGVGENPSDDSTTLQGLFSAEGNIIIDGDNCLGGKPDLRLNIEGALIANAKTPFAKGIGGKVVGLRSLCIENNSQHPYLKVKTRPDFITQLTDFYKTKSSKWEEVMP